MGYYGYGYGGYGYGYGYMYGSSMFAPYGFGGMSDLFGGFGGAFLGGYDDLSYDAIGPVYGAGVGYDPYAPSDSTFVSLGPDISTSSLAESEKPGALRLHVKPDSAAVYVDGNYVGPVHQFNGIFHKLRLDAGNHRIELRASGYQAVTFHVRIEAGETESYRGELDKAAR